MMTTWIGCWHNRKKITNRLKLQKSQNHHLNSVRKYTGSTPEIHWYLRMSRMMIFFFGKDWRIFRTFWDGTLTDWIEFFFLSITLNFCWIWDSFLCGWNFCVGWFLAWVDIFCELIFLHFAWVILVFLLKPDGTRLKMSETESYLSVFVHFRPKSFLPLLFPVRLWTVQVWAVQIWTVRT